MKKKTTKKAPKKQPELFDYVIITNKKSNWCGLFTKVSGLNPLTLQVPHRGKVIDHKFEINDFEYATYDHKARWDINHILMLFAQKELNQSIETLTEIKSHSLELKRILNCNQYQFLKEVLDNLLKSKDRELDNLTWKMHLEHEDKMEGARKKWIEQ